MCEIKENSKVKTNEEYNKLFPNNIIKNGTVNYLLNGIALVAYWDGHDGQLNKLNVEWLELIK